MTRLRQALRLLLATGAKVAKVAKVAVMAVMAMLSLAPLMSGSAHAHEMSMAELSLRETSRGNFVWQWGAGEKASPADELSPRWPDACRADGYLLRCGETGLSGSLGMDGVGKRFSAALVKVAWLDGQTRVYTLSAGQTQVQVHGGADDRRGWVEIARAYTVLGVQHILGGFDHLAFVVGLLLLVGFGQRLLWTISAFTAAHSLTLGLSALGLLTLRPAPVEATIALSIMLVAGEALHQRPTWSRRWPAAVALLFGLVHGLGFAGALKEIGLPEHHLTLALLTFNLGVEAGQLLVLGGCWALWQVLRGLPVWAAARVPALYAMGGVAAYWALGRVLVLLG